jgi:hypothetical protein
MMRVFVMVLTFFVVTVGFGQQDRIQVESDKALKADFSRFKTFAFASMIDSDAEIGFYFLDDLVLKSQLREAVEEQLMGLGYRMDKKSPDLIVNFRVFEEPTTLKGFEGYGGSYWGNAKYRQISDQATYHVKAGTLLLSFAASKSAEVVWQGFASGLINENKFIKDKATIREAVSLLMEEYGVRANSYSLR